MRRGIPVVIAWALACGGKTEVEEEPKASKASKAPAPAKRVAETPAPNPSPIAAPAAVRPRTPATLAEAEALAAQVHTDHRVSFYCGCGFTADLRTLSRSCGYKTRADESRAKSVQWTHVVPARAFGDKRPCWTTESCTRDDGSRFGGIECCRAQDEGFASIENDLFNLVPAITEVAEDRSDYPFGAVAGEPRLYGACDLEVDAAAGVVEPPERVRGDIARIHLYMHAAWGDAVPLTPAQLETFAAWHAEDPPDAWEIDRAAKIQAIQGLASPDWNLWVGTPATEGGAQASGQPARTAKAEAKGDEPGLAPKPAPEPDATTTKSPG